MLGNYATLLGDRRFLGYLLCGGLIYAGLYAYIAVTPFLFIQRLGLPPDAYGTLTILTTSSYIAGSVAGARFGPRLGIDGLLLLGAAAMVALALVHLSVPAVLGPMMVFSVGLGLVLPGAMAGGMLPFPHMAGAASALLGFGQMVLAAAATVIAASLPQLSAITMASLLVVLAGGALATRLTLLRKRPMPRS
jgi:DHA1 family bicyclomycin/chloramphenicol resistance-like MFS transporter